MQSLLIFSSVLLVERNIDDPNRVDAPNRSTVLKSEEEMPDSYSPTIKKPSIEQVKSQIDVILHTTPQHTGSPQPIHQIPILHCQKVIPYNKEYRADTQANWGIFLSRISWPQKLQYARSRKETIPPAIQKQEIYVAILNGNDQGLKIRLRRVPEQEHEEYYKRLA